MGIRTSSLPNLSNPTNNTLLVGINVINETPNNSVKITVANLKSFIISESFLKANQAFIKANASYDTANSGSNYANSAFNYANSAYVWANSSYNFANTTANTLANTEIKLSASYGFANSLYSYINLVYNSANSGISVSANAYIQANSAYNKANSTYDYAVVVNNNQQQIYNVANTASIAAQYANTNATVSYDMAESAVLLSQTANTNACTALSVANSALFIAANTDVKLSSAYNLANDIYDAVTSELNLYPIVNVKRFNVTGDGVTDDTINLQAIINSLSYATIFLPTGIYGITSLQLKEGISIKGDSSNSSVLMSLANNSILLEYNKLQENDDNITISNIGFRANGTVNCVPIGISGNSSSLLCKNVDIHNIKIDAETGFDFLNGINLSNCKNYIISSVISSNCSSDIVIANSVKGQIVNNIFDSNIANNIIETGTSDKNIIMGNITRKRINTVGPNTLKSNNIENASE
jgi:hypothetical protein